MVFDMLSFVIGCVVLAAGSAVALLGLYVLIRWVLG
jgi:hypothetical protein